MTRRIRGAICPHKWEWSDQRVEHPAGGTSFTMTNCECSKCHKRTWAHGRRG